MTNWPEFYDPDRIGILQPPNILTAVQAGQAARLAPTTDDDPRVILLLVDPQVDFIHADGALSVPGAVDDTQRIIEWIFEHVGELSAIAASLDSHMPLQIFYSTWWVNPQGKHPQPYTTITSQDVDQQRWQPVFEPEWSRAYVHKLEQQAKKTLMIWPYHTMIGTPGHSITPTLYEAIAYHSAARESRPRFLQKGMLARSEHYSLLEPEVKVPDQAQGDLNLGFLDMLVSYDLVYIAGQAKSHCVLETINSVMRHFADQPKEIAKWRLLTDCMSSVVHSEIDFERIANETFADYAGKGLTLATSRDPIE